MTAAPLRKNPHLDHYEGLTGTFADACWEADREYAQAMEPVKRQPRNHLVESTRQAIDFLLKQNDPERLRAFLHGRPDAELNQIEQYISRKSQNEHR
jgi:hypothetical protein